MSRKRHVLSWRARDRNYEWGEPGDTAVVGDWNRDGTEKIGVLSQGVWLLDRNGNGSWDGPGIDGRESLDQAADGVPVIGRWRPQTDSHPGPAHRNKPSADRGRVGRSRRVELR